MKSKVYVTESKKGDKSTYMSISKENVDSCWAILQVVPTAVLPTIWRGINLMEISLKW